MILIFTSLNDPHSDAVIGHLNHLEYQFVRVNSEDLFDGLISFQYLFDSDGPFLEINSRGRNWAIRKLDFIYYRRPEKRNTSGLSSEELVQIDELWTSFHSVLYSFTTARWIGHPNLDKHRSSKIFQFNVAKELKNEFVKLPDSIISNNLVSIKLFASKYDELVIKPVNARGLTKDKIWIPFFTERVSQRELLSHLNDYSISDLENAYFIQNYIHKLYEWRVTVIGTSIYPCRIHSQDNELTKSDWRKADYNLIKHEFYDLPYSVHLFCINFLNELGCYFGAFDFIESVEGEYYFLECNLNGQWLWIEELTGLPIAKSIASYLKSND